MYNTQHKYQPEPKGRIEKWHEDLPRTLTHILAKLNASALFNSDNDLFRRL
jgi:hypothetical protein